MYLSICSPQTLEIISSPICCAPLYSPDEFSLSSMTRFPETDSTVLPKESSIYQQTLDDEYCEDRVAAGSRPGSPSRMIDLENTGDDNRIGDLGDDRPSFLLLDFDHDNNLVDDDDRLLLPVMSSDVNLRSYNPWSQLRPATINDEIIHLASGCIYAESEFSIVGAGLRNLGNTCFLNAILQCFTHTVSLVKNLLSLNHVRHYDCLNDDFCALCTLRQHIEASFEYSGSTISPFELFKTASSGLIAAFANDLLLDNYMDSGVKTQRHNISEDFIRYNQEDAHEFLQRFLERLADSSRISKRIPDDGNLSQENNLVNHIFGGRLISNLRCCNCGHSSDTYEPLVDISLEIEDRDNLVSALESFTKVEMMEDPESRFTCENCNELVSGEKQLKLDLVPSVAAFHLKRFKNNGVFIEKIDKHVDFPLELDLQPYTCIPDDECGLIYELYAVVVHDGYSSGSGHYFCFIRSSPNTWHKFDDSKVYRVDESTVLSQGAYILFYARQGTPCFSSFVEANKACFELNLRNTSPKSTSPTSVLENVHDTSNALQRSASPTLPVVNDPAVELVSDPENISPSRESCDQMNVPNALAVGLASDLEKTSPYRKSCYQMNVLNAATVGLASDPEKTPPVRKSCYQTPKSPDKTQTIPSIDMYFKTSPEIVLPSPHYDSKKRKKSSTSKETQVHGIADSKEMTEACRYMKKKMPSSRSAKLLAAMRGF